MDMLEYATRCLNDIHSLLLRPPATPESLNEPETEQEYIKCDVCGCLEPALDVEYKVCHECREPEHPAEDLGHAVEIMRGERVV